MKTHFHFLFALFLALLVLAGCGGPRQLVAPPSVFPNNGYPLNNVPSHLQSTEPEVMYVTDRVAIDSGYGAERSFSVEFGRAKIAFGDTGSWDTLVTHSQSGARKPPTHLSREGITRLGSLPATPLPFRIRDGRPVDDPDAARTKRIAEDALKSEIRKDIRKTGNRDVLVLIHGFNTGFDESLFSLAELWHYTGRNTVPISYSWPSGAGGLFGYFTDRESGEFTILHLKEFLRTLSSIPDVSRIHILAHSRGTDVATTALRELVIEARAAGKNPKSVLKIENLILAAPDLDFGVVSQRLIAERFGPAFGRITVYTNANDSALLLSQRLMQGTRFGRIGSDALSPTEQQIFRNVRNVHFVSVPRGEGFFGHAYFREDPDVLSDIALILNENADPGGTLRPLVRQSGNFWLLPDGYPFHTDAND